MAGSLMRESTAGRPTRDWERAADRRQGLSNLLAQALDLALITAEAQVRRSRLERDIGALFNGCSVSIREIRLEGTERPGFLRVPLPGLSDPSMMLEVRTDEQEFDPWMRQLLDDAARIASFVLGAGARPVAATPERRRLPGPAARKLIGDSLEITQLHDQVSRMARTDFTVLIEGQSGSGKELVARLIHEESGRRRRPFVAVNCAALVETLLEAELFGIEERTATGVRGRLGKFELADGGTLFLDEVSDLSATAQAKLLRVLQERAIEKVGGHVTRVVNTRIVAATNQGLEKLVEAGRFRADLYYRLSGVEIHVPPLRARRSDIPTLANHFLAGHRSFGNMRLSLSAMDALSSYDWPGNVRELQRVIERAVALPHSHEITVSDLPAKVAGDVASILEPSLEQTHTIRAWASRYARLVLERCDHNKRRACGVLGISYHTLQSYLGHDESETMVAVPAQAVRNTP